MDEQDKASPEVTLSVQAMQRLRDMPMTLHGPWEREPDFVEFTEQGLRCVIKRSEASGAYCGYVLVPQAHPFHGLDTHHADIDALRVHGGVTWAGEHDFSSAAWAIGFDCAHSGDLMPKFEAAREQSLAFAGLSAAELYGDDTYRDLSYAACETRDLAKQIAQAARG